MKHPMKNHPNRRLRAAAICLLPLALAACPQPQQTAGQQIQEQKAENRFTADDAVGNLGGIPIRLSGYIPSTFVEYEDTPAGLSDEWKTYKRPKRTLESRMEGFTVELNLETGKLFDVSKDSISGFYEEAGKPNTPWASVVFDANKEPYPPDFLNDVLANDLREKKPKLPAHTFKKTGQTQYGLEIYVQLAPNPNTGFSKTLFIARDKQGNVSSYIKCSNNNVPNPPCSHEFVSKASPYIMFQASYSRHRLQDWQNIEKLVEEKLAEFADNAKHPNRKL